MISLTVDAVGRGVWTDTVQLLRHGWFCMALVAWVGSGCVREVTAYAAALWVGLAFRAASGGVSKAPAEGALGGRYS